MNGWQDLMDLVYACYQIGQNRRAVAIRMEAQALRQDIARFGCVGPFFNARWPYYWFADCRLPDTCMVHRLEADARIRN